MQGSGFGGQGLGRGRGLGPAFQIGGLLQKPKPVTGVDLGLAFTNRRDGLVQDR